ncbi:hypothetical protein ACQEVB_35110 [Pseudonocardia sp. CA-107938]|uniref:hypothetical protein n=1 Tax=Pseudonocardia sp. CA-107938 TaxID=3240021 RepID=UPI003D8E6930
MSPVAAPAELDLDLDLEVVEEASETSEERKLRCVRSASGCCPRSFRSVDLD